MADTLNYAGSELELFAHARNWKEYFKSALAPHVHGDVLEVGAGLGGTTRVLRSLSKKSWTCIEPDPALLAELSLTIGRESLQAVTHQGTLDSVPTDSKFDTILYVDVLEHIEHDAEELLKAAQHLTAGGKIVVLSPAHSWLYTPFDRAIGHFRRYSKEALQAICPPACTNTELFFLDSVGLLASGANRVFLKSSMPSVAQVAVWDRLMVPMSTYLDKILRRRIGKSIVATYALTSPGAQRGRTQVSPLGISNRWT